MALDPAQIAFVSEYELLGFANATEAMARVRPDLKRASAAAAGCRLLQHPEVREEVERRLALWRARNRLTVEAFGDNLLDALRVDVLDFYDELGNLRPLYEIPMHARRQIASIETVEQIINDEPVLVKRVKLWDRRKAEEMWAKWQKMLTDRVDLTSGDKPLKVSFVMNFGQEK